MYNNLKQMLNGYIKTMFILKDSVKAEEFFTPEFSYTLVGNNTAKSSKESLVNIYDVLEEGNRISAIFELNGEHQFVLLHVENDKFSEAWTTHSAIFPKGHKAKK